MMIAVILLHHSPNEVASPIAGGLSDILYACYDVMTLVLQRRPCTYVPIRRKSLLDPLLSSKKKAAVQYDGRFVYK